MSPTLLIIGLILIIIAASGCIGGIGDLSGFETSMNGDSFCHVHGYDDFAVDGKLFYCLKYDNYNRTLITEKRRITKLADGSFAFSLSSGGG